MSDLVPVRVRHSVERVVYVAAESKAEARKLARDVSNWRDAAPICDDLATVEGVRVVGVENAESGIGVEAGDT